MHAEKEKKTGGHDEVERERVRERGLQLVRGRTVMQGTSKRVIVCQRFNLENQQGQR
jgi:hypothetical protein